MSPKAKASECPSLINPKHFVHIVPAHRKTSRVRGHRPGYLAKLKLPARYTRRATQASECG